MYNTPGARGVDKLRHLPSDGSITGIFFGTIICLVTAEGCRGRVDAVGAVYADVGAVPVFCNAQALSARALDVKGGAV